MTSTDQAMTSDEAARRVSHCALLLRKLAGELVVEGSGYAHVAEGVADALLNVLRGGAMVVRSTGGCRQCGDPLPPPAHTGRPRSHCLRCSPKRTRIRSALNPDH